MTWGDPFATWLDRLLCRLGCHAPFYNWLDASETCRGCGWATPVPGTDWTRTADRLPAPQMRVSVYAPNAGYYGEAVCFGGRWFREGKDLWPEPTHWKPTPPSAPTPEIQP